MLKYLPFFFLGVIVSACGARTGFLDDFYPEAGPDSDIPDVGTPDGDIPDDGTPDADGDVNGTFPCNYSPTGDYWIVGSQYSDNSFFPELIWADGTLAAVYSYPGQGEFIREIGFFDSINPWDYWGLLIDSEAVSSTKLGWNGEDLVALWVEYTETSNSPLFMVDNLDLGRSYGSLDLALPPHSACWGLEWSGDRFIAAFGDYVVSEQWTRITVYELESSLSFLGDELLSVDLNPQANHSFYLASDGGNVVASWIEEEEIFLQVIAGPSVGNSFEQRISAYMTDYAVAIHNGEAALVWAEEDDDVPGDTFYDLYMRRIDLSGDVGESTLLASGEGLVGGVNVIGVGEGYLAVFNEFSAFIRNTHRILIAPTRSQSDLSIEVRQTIEMYNADSHWAFTNQGESVSRLRPSLAYDGLDVYVAASYGRDVTHPEVRIRELSCHR